MGILDLVNSNILDEHDSHRESTPVAGRENKIFNHVVVAL